MNNEEFFDGVSEFYDDMISFDTALANRRGALSEFIPSSAKYAADLGCGTGLDSLSLALNGLDVTAFDISQGMLDNAFTKARQHALNIKFNKYSLTDIPSEYNGRFDMAVSLGNTLANLNESQLEEALSRAYAILKENGTLLLQILNYHPLQKNNERIINITENGSTYFVRFYDFLGEGLQFNILSFDKNDAKKRELKSTLLYPHEEEVFRVLLTEAGFKDFKVYGSLTKSPFDPANSKDMIISVVK